MAWRILRQRPGAAAGALIALAISTVLVSAFAFVVGSADRQVPVVVGADGGVPREVADMLARLPEVADAASEVRFPATVLGDGQRVVEVPGSELAHSWGLGWSSAWLTPFGMVDGDPPGGRDEVAVDHSVARAAGLDTGDTVSIATLGAVFDFAVVGIVEPAEGPDWRFQSAVFFEDARAVELRGRDPERVDAVGLFPATGVTAGELRMAAAEALERAAGEYLVAAGGDRGELERTISVSRDQQAAASHQELVVTAVVVGVSVVAGALGLAFRSRGRELAMLRAVGATPRQVVVMVLGEAAVLSAAAAMVGLPLGAALARWVTGWDLGPQAGVSGAFIVHHPLRVVAGTALLILAAAQAAALLASRHALRVPPAEALSDATREGQPVSRLCSASESVQQMA